MTQAPEPGAGPCPHCGSADTRPITTKPPRTHPGRTIACDADCSQPARLCLSCRLATPLPATDRPEHTP